MKQFVLIIVALIIGTAIGSTFGWVLCNQANQNVIAAIKLEDEQEFKSFDSQLQNMKKQVEIVLASDSPKVKVGSLYARKIYLIGDDGKTCMLVVGSSGTDADYRPHVSTSFFFYDYYGRVTHYMGASDGSFMLLSKNEDGGDNWGIREPQTSFYSRFEKDKRLGP